jgi:hypothetical protein
MAKSFTNVKTRDATVSVPQAQTTRPYVSKGAISSLTSKEKEARRIQRVQRSAAADLGLPRMIRTADSGSINTSMASAGQFFSPQLSTDFLELPQSLREKREIYRHFYNTDPIVGQSIDLHTELPMSKVLLARPKPSSFPEGFKDQHDYAAYIYWFFTQMAERIKLVQRLITMVHHYWLDGGVFVFAEDSGVDIPEDLGYDKQEGGTKSVVTESGEAREEPDVSLVERQDREDQELDYYAKNYAGWDRLIILPIDQVKVTTYSFTDKMRIELIPADRDKALIEQAKSGDPFAEEMVKEIPEEVREHIEQGKLIPLGTDPDEGSFCYYLAGRRGAGEDLGQSILDRVLRTLMYREKLRQAQTQIASRAMTPKRIVWGDRISEADVLDLREQVDLALVDPDYSIVTNYEIHWEEMGSKDRLLDLTSEYEITDKQLYAGLGVTESLLSGETLYSGDRLKLEVINTRYMFLREMVQEYVEKALFKPVARRKGFVEKNAWGGEVVLYPRLQFARLPLRDSQDTFDQMFNLYNKGSLSIDLILEMWNIDPDDTRVKLERDLFTVNDALFNEVMRSIYNSVGQTIVDTTDVASRIINSLNLQKVEKEAPAEEGRF